MLTFFCWYSIWPLIPTKDDDELPCLSTLAFPSYLARRHPPGLFQYPIGNTAGYGSHIASFHSTCQYCTHLHGILVQGLYQPIKMLVLSTSSSTMSCTHLLGILVQGLYQPIKMLVLSISSSTMSFTHLQCCEAGPTLTRLRLRKTTFL